EFIGLGTIGKCITGNRRRWIYEETLPKYFLKLFTIFFRLLKAQSEKSFCVPARSKDTRGGILSHLILTLKSFFMKSRLLVFATVFLFYFASSGPVCVYAQPYESLFSHGDY